MRNDQAFRMEIAAALRAARRSKGMSQQELAQSADCSIETISNVERAASMPSLENFFAIASVLDFDPGRLSKAKADASKVSRQLADLRAQAAELALQFNKEQLRLWVAIGELLFASRGQG